MNALIVKVELEHIISVRPWAGAAGDGGGDGEGGVARAADGKVRYQMRVTGKMTMLSSVLLGEMTIPLWMIPDLG